MGAKLALLEHDPIPDNKEVVSEVKFYVNHRVNRVYTENTEDCISITKHSASSVSPL